MKVAGSQVPMTMLRALAAAVALAAGLYACGGQDAGEADAGSDLGVFETAETVPDGADDPDGDGFTTEKELAFGTDPYNDESHPPDLDGDKVADAEDPDIDGDGVENPKDAFPYDAAETADTDNDGTGNGADVDDDGDGFPDQAEVEAGTDPLDAGSHPGDLDGDGVADDLDADKDGDGVENVKDAFPADAMEWADTDGDGEGDNGDDDDDGDGYPDTVEEKFGTDPLDADDHPDDLDGDGIPDGEDLDLDGDGVENAKDAFPMDGDESADTDGDGAGNNADLDDDGDGYPDAVEKAAGTDPLDAGSTPVDLDGDMLPDSEDADIDGDGTLNANDAFPADPKEWLDTDGDGMGDNKETDDDADGYPDWVEAQAGTDPKDPGSVPGDTDGDGIPDKDDVDADGDGVLNSEDAFPYDATETTDTDGDGTGDGADVDDDGDGYPDAVEVELGFDPLAAENHPSDVDGDGVPDDSDDDIDGDGAGNDTDAFPYDASETLDTDGDGTGDAADADDDGDGFTDDQEAEQGTDPLDPADLPGDVDGDLIPDAQDDDIDGDGAPNSSDAFPSDPTETTDTDGDGTGDGADPDDDGDGYSDADEAALGTDAKDPAVHPLDLDGDGIADPSDPDVDGDGVPNGDDAFPMDEDESVDTDGDGKGNAADTDDDGDGYPDAVEVDQETDPLDADDHPSDMDKDGVPDGSDLDIDGDGIANGDDAFPKDPSEWLDQDGDGVGSEADDDDDGDGFSDAIEEAFLTDPTSPFSFPADLDGDKLPDAIDPDRDGDGVLNAEDAFPADPVEWLDSDGDGTGDAADLDDDGDGFADDLEVSLGYDPKDFKSHPADLDGDGTPDVSDPDVDGDGVLNGDDAFPGNPVDWDDTDTDGIGDNTDLDDDGDGYPDALELEYGTDPLDGALFPVDQDGDGIPDSADPDVDGDLVKNDVDAFPLDPAEWADTDADGTGNNTDLDDDGDGYLDAVEAQYLSDPLDGDSIPPDIDLDGIPDPEDLDRDGDGVPNIDDAFPDNPEAWEEVLDEGSFGGGYQDTIPDDADPKSYDSKRFSLVRGKILDDQGAPLEGVSVRILEHTEYGSVLTDEKGEYTVPVNGGLTLTVAYSLDGYTEAQRFVSVPWNDMIVVDTVELVPHDPEETEVFMSGDPDEVLVHTASGAEKPITIAVTGDNLAVAEDKEGNLEVTDTLVLSATEYKTPDQMPGELPSTSEFTYCVDLKAEGYDHVEFDQPVLLWTSNTLGFDVGVIVPTGYYDRDDGKWKPMDDGLVVELLDTDGDTVIDSVDGTGDGVADDLDGDGDKLDEVTGIDLQPEAMAGDTWWRVAVTHFSPVDMNWPASGPPPDASPPPDDPASPDDQDGNPDDDDPCKQKGNSEIDIRSRVLHQNIPIPGTDFSLHYSSAWVPGFAMPITIPASGDTVPKSLSEIVVNYSIAGRSFTKKLPAQPNQSVDFLWDGKDFQGNVVNQRMQLSTEVGFKYPASYYGSRAAADTVGASFAAMGVEATGINAFRPVTLWRRNKVPVYRLQPETAADAWGMGMGWTPTVYNYYDASSESVLLGDGRKVKGDQQGVAITTAGGKQLAIEPRLVEVDSDGVLYFAAKGNPLAEKQIWKQAPGKDAELYATMSARVGDISVGPDDTLYVTVGSFLWRIPGKTATPVLMASLYLQFFNCFAYFGDYCQLNVDVDEWGYAFLVSRYPAAFGSSSMGIVSPDGTVLANPVDLQCTAFDIAVGAEGLMVAACKNGPVRKIDRDGTVTTYEGWAPNCTEFFGYTDPTGVEVLPDGAVLVADEKCNRVRKILPDGTVTTVAGTGKAGYAGDDDAPLAADLSKPTDVTLGPDSATYIADSGNKRIRAVRRVKSVISLTGNEYGVPIEGDRILVFGEKLEQLEERDMLSGTTVRTFTHAPSGVLLTETLASGREVGFTADAQGRIIEILGTSGEVTTLSYNDSGALAAITLPDETKYSFDYLAGGLMKSKSTPKGGTFKYTYDNSGRVTKVEDPRGGWTKYYYETLPKGGLSKTVTAEGKQVQYLDTTDGEGNQTSIVIDALGGEKTFTVSGDGWESSQLDSAGTVVDVTISTDPKFATPYQSRSVVQTPSGLVNDTQTTRSYDDVQGQVSVVSSTNGNAISTVYDQGSGVSTVTTASGRTVLHQFDPETGALAMEQDGDLSPVAYERDDEGRLVKESQGDRIVNYEYDEAGTTTTVTDAVGNTYELVTDGMGRVAAQVLSDGSEWTYEYDADSYLSAIVAPGGRRFQASTDFVGLTTKVITPGGNEYAYAFNLDREETLRTYPAGGTAKSQLFNGLLVKRTVGADVTTFEYMNDASGRLKSATSSDGVVTAWTWDGALKTAAQYSGAFSTSMTWEYDDDFRVMKQTAGGVSHTFGYNADGQLSKSDGLTIVRKVGTGQVTSIGDGTLLVTYEYNQFGEPTQVTWKVAGATVYQASVTWRKDGRMQAKTETVSGEAHTFAYAYDALGRLTEVKVDGVVREAYSYDAFSNRTSAYSPALGQAPVAATFDTDDRLTKQGALQVSHDADGFATQVKNTSTSGTTTFQYAADGRLEKLTAEDGTKVDYLYDALGTLAARKSGGLVDRIYLYDGPGVLRAVLNGAGQALATFTHAGTPVPVMMKSGSQTWYLVHDVHFNVRLAVTPQGAVAQQYEYDAYGAPLSQEDPGFETWIGFAGALDDLGVVRMGERDYLPLLGRWASRDPVAPVSGFNAYAYAGCDPVNAVDFTGLFEISGGAGAGAHGDVKIGYSQGQGWVTVCVGLGGGASVGVDFFKKPPINLGNKNQAVQFFVEGTASATIPVLFKVAASAGLYGAAGCDEASVRLGGTGEAFMTEFAKAGKKYGMDSGWGDSTLDFGLKKNYTDKVFGNGGEKAVQFGASAKVAGCMTYQRRLR